MIQQKKPLFERQNEEFMSRISNGEITDFELIEAHFNLLAVQRRAYYESCGGSSMYVSGLIIVLYLGLRGYPDKILLWVGGTLCVAAIILKHREHILKRREWQTNISRAQEAVDARLAECGQH